MYNNVSTRDNQSFPYCGLLPPPYNTIVMQNCYAMDTALLLCDVTSATESDVAQQVFDVIEVTSPPSRNRTDHPEYVVCKQGHMTHDFLSCDVLSSCLTTEKSWKIINTALAWDVPSPSSCTTDVQPPPPSFPCSKGLEHVPYTLVCDHRHDCRDGSDERFCHFPPCTVDQLPCRGSHQVGCVSKVTGNLLRVLGLV